MTTNGTAPHTPAPVETPASQRIPTIDAHHHIWRQTDLPWLLGPMRPRIFGPYEAIKRDYSIDEYLADIADAGVAKSVYVQANWAPNWAADEAAWVQSVADATGWPHGIVGYADMTVADVRPQLEKLARQPRMRGIRQQLHWHENPLYRFAPRPDLAADPMVRTNVARLAAYGWTFELQVFAGQVEPAAALVAACPEVVFVLQHAGMPEDRSEAGQAAWRAALQRLSAYPNVRCKLSAFGTFIHRNDPEHIAAILRDAVAIFGAERCLFGSNFPIEKLWTDYAALLAAFRAAASDLSGDDQRAIFHRTAATTYRLTD